MAITLAFLIINELIFIFLDLKL